MSKFIPKEILFRDNIKIISYFHFTNNVLGKYFGGDFGVQLS